MEMNLLWGIMSIVMLLFGLYAFIAYFRMRKGGPVDKFLILGNEFPEEKCKNIKLLRERSLPAILIFAIGTSLFGILEMIHAFVRNFGVWNIIPIMLFFIVLFWFEIYIAKLKSALF